MRDQRARYVYFVQAATTRLVKIGVARDPRKRTCDMQVGSPDKLTLVGVIASEDPHALERKLHGQFRGDWSHGEWFEPSDELAALVEAQADEPPPERPPRRVRDKIAAAVARRKAAEAATPLEPQPPGGD